jgi:prolipoprotein diacylglyceryltransferase
VTPCLALLASIPSPSSNALHIGPFQLRAYGLMIALGVVAAVWLTGRRLERHGVGTREDMSAIALFAVPAGVVGSRIYHVITDWKSFRGDWWRAFKIWEGGLGIWGGIAAGTLVAVWVARRRGVAPVPLIDDAAPGLALAQAIGRWGNYFNQELFGKPTTLPVTLDEIVYHAEMVVRAVKRALVIVDMPFMSFQLGPMQAVENAGAIIKRTGASAVKLEAGVNQAATIEALSAADIPVMAHVGLKPQSVLKLGGYKIQRDEQQLVADARAAQDSGEEGALGHGFGFVKLQPCPPGSSSTVALTQRTALIGRSSQSRDIHPEIALEGDTGVSRRHAQLVRDGDGVSVIDLSSTNGTYVVPTGTEPTADTDAIQAGLPTQLHDGDRIYLGAWSRLTIRLG